MVFDFKELVGEQLRVPTFRENIAKEKASSDAVSLLFISDLFTKMVIIIIAVVILIALSKVLKF